MRIPTVTLKHKSTGETIVVNECDYALGSIPGIDLSTNKYVRVSETHGNSDEAQAIEEAKEAAEVARKFAEREANGKAPKAK